MEEMPPSPMTRKTKPRSFGYKAQSGKPCRSRAVQRIWITILAWIGIFARRSPFIFFFTSSKRKKKIDFREAVCRRPDNSFSGDLLPVIGYRLR
jgi:hypothetical protein